MSAAGAGPRLRTACIIVLAGLCFGARAGTPAASRHAPAAHGTEALLKAGEDIYLRGLLSSGLPVQAIRESGNASGADAACVNCHRHSGLGSTHQSNGVRVGLRSSQIPPIAGRYLFENGTGREAPNLPYVDGMRTDRPPYTPETLARALRDGIDPSGRRLGALMPRFDLPDGDLAALVAYLKTLYPPQVPGVSPGTLHFATVVAPGVDPARRGAMLEVMQKFFAERNSRQMVQSAPLRASGHTQYSRSMFMVHRQWQLHVWDLVGPASTWGAQLERYFAREPVLAVVSGLARDWTPVHEFCERQRVPCLFPNVEVPVEAPGDFYELYLSRALLLEADLIGTSLASAQAGSPAKNVYQVYRAGDSGEAGAKELGKTLRGRGTVVHDVALEPAGGSVAAAVQAASGADALVLWLRPDDLAALGDARAAPPLVYVSGQMGGLENAPLPAAWRELARMAYPYDLPEKRTVREDYALGWFRIRGIKVVDEQMQADTYLACGLVSEALNGMVDAFYGPYLIEELQAMAEHRIVTGYYPRLSLAEGQQFASKGGYLVRFRDREGPAIAAASEWIVP